MCDVGSEAGLMVHSGQPVDNFAGGENGVMVKLLSVLLLPLLAGCATGHAKDWFRSSDDTAGNVIYPQLLRYGLNVEQSRCLSGRLSRRLPRFRLREFQARAAAVRPESGSAGPLTLANLRAVAGSLPDRQVRLEMDNAANACGISSAAMAAAPVAVAATPAPPRATAGAGPAPTPAASGEAPVPTGRLLTGDEAVAAFSGRGVPIAGIPAVATGAQSAALNPVWLNLGSAGTGQAISIDAASIEQDEESRSAWFRMVDPNTAPSLTWYQLRSHGAARSIEPLARRKVDAAGRELEYEVYAPGVRDNSAVETGTVTEIAWLSLCT